MAVRAGGTDVTRETAATVAGTEAEAVAVMTVAVTTVVADMTAGATSVAEEADLLVWGKLRCATAPKVPLCAVEDEI